MTIEKEKLKALAERAVAGNPPGGDGNPFPALAVRAVDVLALLAEIERLESEAMHTAAGVQSDREQRDQLKAENEALRKQVADLSPFKNAPPQDYRSSNKCLACGEYHHGLGNLPCPRCTPVAQSAMAKEASHG
jgi:phage shock protein A